MQTIRGRLTAWYSAALVLTLPAIAAVLYLDRRSASYQDLDQRMRSEASLTAGILAESYRARGVLVRPDTANRPVLIPDVAALLEAVPDILIVAAGDGSLLFASSDARALTIHQTDLLGRTATRAPEGAPEDTLQEIKRMTELVEALLTLARADEGIAPLHREPVDLRGIVEEARETGELLAEEAGVRMEGAPPAEPVVVSVDATRIRQLILNLLTNAVKYTPAGGSVRLRLGPANGRLTLSVADTGIGIAPGDLPHIFDRFWRADSARQKRSKM